MMTDAETDSSRRRASGAPGGAETPPAGAADRAGVFAYVRESWVGAAMLGLALACAVVWTMVPVDADSSIVRDLRDRVGAFGPGDADAGDGPTRLARRSVPDARPQVARLPSPTVAALEKRFERLDYDLDAVRAQAAEVPRVLPQDVPRDLGELERVERKKSVFFQMVLPLVLMANERLRDQRARIMTLMHRVEADESIAADQRDWLDRMFESYGVEPGEFRALLRRVDVVPPSLALAQAAIESGWGTSRFAREGNALFGQWVWGDDAEGLVPSERESGKDHKIRTFRTPLQAVAAYIKNLNTHDAYAKLRRMRATLREQGAGLNGLTLAGGLESYSEKGMKYVELVRNIIAVNELRPLDKAQLAAGESVPPNV